MIACVAHFPNRPVHPPSEAAAAKRDHDAAPRVDASGLCAYFGGGGALGVVPAAGAGDSASMAIEHQHHDYRDHDHDHDHDHGDGGASLARVTSPRFVSPRRPLVLKYWVVSTAMAIPLGMYQGWSSVLYVIIVFIHGFTVVVGQAHRWAAETLIFGNKNPNTVR